MYDLHLQIEHEIVEIFLLDAVMQTNNVRVLKLAANASLSLQLLKV